MTVRGYLWLLRRRWMLVFLGAAAGVVVAVALSLLAAPAYTSQVQLFVGTRVAEDPRGDTLHQAGLFAQQRVKSYVRIVDSSAVTERVISRLDLDLTPRQLEAKISAEAPLDTVLINVDVTDTSPERAREIANATAREFVSVVRDIETTTRTGGSQIDMAIVREADTPSSPTSPRPRLNGAVGLLVGLLLGALLAVARDRLDRTIPAPNAVEEHLGVPILGVVPRDRAVERDPTVVRTAPQTKSADGLRRLRAAVQLHRNVTPLLVTSALPGEGKTTVAVNLALAVAEAGKRVIVIDADLRAPGVAEALGLEQGPGLVQVLQGHATLREAAQEWGPGLIRVLHAGGTARDPAVLLRSPRLGDLVRTLAEQEAFVIVDTPALEQAADALIFAPHVAGALVVVRASRTPREAVQHAIAELGAAGADVLGVVLNMTTRNVPPLRVAAAPPVRRLAPPEADLPRVVKQ
jgi:succinoglycan biosynthesis transport protein ExoP